MNSYPSSKNNSDKQTKGKLFYTLSFKIQIYFSTLFLIVIALLIFLKTYGIPFTEIDGDYQRTQSEVFKNLNLVADLKKERLLRNLKERRDDTIVLTESRLMKSLISELQIRIQQLQKKGVSKDLYWKELQKEEVYKILNHQLNLVKNTYAIYKKILQEQ